MLGARHGLLNDHTVEEGSREAFDDPQPLGARVAAESVLIALLSRAAWHFEDAAHLAAALGAYRIAAWGERQAQLTRALIDHERKEPGYTVRWEIARKAARG